ncbi:MAG: hypothetical protein C0601_03070 [Candidatus Muiribacterium halophilum]|uniref:Uncharacterized protein n=1 Tax=Muiribacterium halophilum TaxID=2053465 RepID=A0A2N5ZK28_MUIH1|nr:MAG: hypothetical protein C0601_03070 [Candidatus Muirbacterium halophilum]
MKKLYLLFLFIIFISLTANSVILLLDDYKYNNYSTNSRSPYYELIDVIKAPGDVIDQFHYPQGLALDMDNNLYIADSKNSRIWKFKDDTFESVVFTDVLLPVDLEYSATSGTLFVTDEESHSIIEFYTDGKIEKTIGGTLGYRGSNLSYPSGICLKGNFLFLTDRLADNVKKIDTLNKFSTILDESGKESGQLNEPADIWINSKGWIYITNYGNDRVEIFNPDLYYAGKIGERGINLSQFRGPYGITGDIFDNIFVCDSHNGRVQRFSEDGIASATIGEGILKNPKFCVVNNEGILYVSDVFENKIYVFSPKMFEIGRKYYMDKDFKKAIKFLEYAIKIDKNNLNAYYYLAYSFFELESFKDVIRVQKSLKELSPGSRAYELTNILVKQINKWEDLD